MDLDFAGRSPAQRSPVERANGTMPRAEKGPIAPPPVLAAPMQTVVDAVAAWPGAVATMHWHFSSWSQPDGVDFYVGEEELGHIHLDGSVHLATSPSEGKALIAAGLAHPFRYARGWVEAEIRHIGPDAAIELFRQNYERVRAVS